MAGSVGRSCCMAVCLGSLKPVMSSLRCSMVLMGMCSVPRISAMLSVLSLRGGYLMLEISVISRFCCAAMSPPAIQQSNDNSCQNNTYGYQNSHE